MGNTIHNTLKLGIHYQCNLCQHIQSIFYIRQKKREKSSPKKYAKKKVVPKKEANTAMKIGIGPRYFLGKKNEQSKNINDEPNKKTQMGHISAFSNQNQHIPNLENAKEDEVKEEIEEQEPNSTEFIPSSKPKLGFSMGIGDKIGEPLQVNLKQICRCLAFAIMKHIEFSQEKNLLCELGTMEPLDLQNNDMLKINVKDELEFPKEPEKHDSDDLNDILSESITDFLKNKFEDKKEEKNAYPLKFEQDSEIVNLETYEENKGDPEISMESHYQPPAKTEKDNYNQYLKESILIFHHCFNFITNEMDSYTESSPTEKEIYKYAKRIMIRSKMEKEIPIIALLYIEKVMLKTGILINSSNWKRFTLISLVIGSKIWDDDSFENVHFTKVMTELSLREVNELERVFLELLDYKLFINGSEYAKYYFILRTYSEKVKKEKFDVDLLKEGRLAKIQQGISKIESKLRLQYNYEQTI